MAKTGHTKTAKKTVALVKQHTADVSVLLSHHMAVALWQAVV